MVRQWAHTERPTTDQLVGFVHAYIVVCTNCAIDRTPKTEPHTRSNHYHAIPRTHHAPAPHTPTYPPAPPCHAHLQFTRTHIHTHTHIVATRPTTTQRKRMATPARDVTTRKPDGYPVANRTLTAHANPPHGHTRVRTIHVMSHICYNPCVPTQTPLVG